VVPYVVWLDGREPLKGFAMKLMRKLAALGVAAEAARRYAQKNPEQVRKLTDKAAAFADQRTKGKYRGQIESVKRTLADLGGYGASEAAGGQQPSVTGRAEVTSTNSDAASDKPRPTPYRRG
jgi:MT0933-like antitoxin protein